MLVHTVLFWLKPDLNDAQRAAFRVAVEGLLAIPSVRHGWVGVPSSTDRPVIERSYSIALTVVFDDLAGHDAYQVHSVHLAFVKANASNWTRVMITDAE